MPIVNYVGLSSIQHARNINTLSKRFKVARNGLYTERGILLGKRLKNIVVSARLDRNVYSQAEIYGDYEFGYVYMDLGLMAYYFVYLLLQHEYHNICTFCVQGL